MQEERVNHLESKRWLTICGALREKRGYLRKNAIGTVNQPSRMCGSLVKKYC